MSTALPFRPTTLADRLVGRSFAASLGSVLAGTALTALLAQVVIRLPFTPVPLTLQTLAVLTVGGVLGSRRGALSMALYILLGVVGLPVFAGGTSGFVGALGGYLLGFIAAAAVVGALAERGWDRSRRVVLAMILGELALYAIGLPWLALYVGVGRALMLGFFPFLLGDGLKLLVAAGLLPFGWKLLGGRRGVIDRV